MLIGLEGAHAFYVSIFGGVEHLRAEVTKLGKFLLVLCMTAAVTIAGVLMWKAEATPIGGSHKFPRCDQELFDHSKGGVHVRHPSLSCGHQMVLRPLFGTNSNCKEMRLPPLLVPRAQRIGSEHGQCLPAYGFNFGRTVLA